MVISFLVIVVGISAFVILATKFFTPEKTPKKYFNKK